MSRIKGQGGYRIVPKTRGRESQVQYQFNSIEHIQLTPSNMARINNAFKTNDTEIKKKKNWQIIEDIAQSIIPDNEYTQIKIRPDGVIFNQNGIASLADIKLNNVNSKFEKEIGDVLLTKNQADYADKNLMTVYKLNKDRNNNISLFRLISHKDNPLKPDEFLLTRNDKRKRTGNMEFTQQLKKVKQCHQ